VENGGRGITLSLERDVRLWWRRSFKDDQVRHGRAKFKGYSY